MIIQATPDSSCRNYRTESLLKDVSLLWRPYKERLVKNGRRFHILPQETLTHRLVMRHNSVMFLYEFNDIQERFFTRLLRNTWEKATFIPFTEFLNRPSDTVSYYLRLAQHDVYSLKTDHRDSAPLDSILSLCKDLNEGEWVELTVELEPYGNAEWNYYAEDALRKIQKGLHPRRPSLSKSDIPIMVASLVSSGLESAQSFMSEFFTNTKSQVETYVPPHSLQTTRKTSSPAFKVRVSIHATNDMLARTVGNAFHDLSGDNQITVHKMSGKAIPFMVLSHSEAGKFIQLPGKELQDMYPQIHAIKRKEVSLPELLFDESGIPLCDYTERGTTRRIHFPLHDMDLAMHPLFIWGQQGVGKTDGFGANWALETLKRGWGCFHIDTNKGSGIHKVVNALPADFPKDKIVILDGSQLDYVFPIVPWSELAGKEFVGSTAKLVSNVMTSRLVAFINALGSEQERSMTPRMERWVSAVGNTIFSQRGNGLVHLFRAFQDQKYAESLLDVASQSRKTDIEDFLQAMSSPTQLRPIHDRIGMLRNNELLSNIFLQKNNSELSFRKFMDEGYYVGIYYPGNIYVEGIDRIITAVIYKIYMAALSRYDIADEKLNPASIIMDEPHQYLSAGPHLTRMCVELRKYRVKPIFMAHYLGQMGKVGLDIQAGGAQYIAYKSKHTHYNAMADELYPFTPQELVDTLAPKGEAGVKLEVKGETQVPMFIGDMLKPPKQVSNRYDECVKRSARKYGKWYEQVESEIDKELRGG
jgi:hypothetical protein